MKNPSSSAISVPSSAQVAGADAQHADFGSPDGARELDAGVQRNLLAADQADPAAEERVHIGAGAGNAAWRFRAGARKAEDAGAFEKERALLGKQQREAREIDLARIDFRLAEIGVERRRQPEARRDAVEDIEAGLAAEVVVVVAACQVQPSPGEERTQIQPDPLREPAEVRDFTGFGYLKKLRVEARARPPIVLELARDGSSDVEAPDALLRPEN